MTKCSFVQSLATAIASTKVLLAQQVVKNESGEEVGVNVGKWVEFVHKLVKMMFQISTVFLS